jgi:hypothetical protein
VTALPAATEARVLAAFAEACMIDARTAAELLHIDVKSLRFMTRAGAIGFVIKGASTICYREVDIRGFLGGAPAASSAIPEDTTCRSTGPRASRSSSTTSRSKVVAITARPGKERDAPPRRLRIGFGARSGKASTATPRG